MTRDEAGDLNNVVFCGWTDSIADYYAAMDVFVYPSHFEAQGSGILEAMSLGCSVVVTANSSLVEIVRDAAVYATGTDAPAIADALRLVLANDELERLAGTFVPNITPVVIARQIDWVTPPVMSASV